MPSLSIQKLPADAAVAEGMFETVTSAGEEPETEAETEAETAAFSFRGTAADIAPPQRGVGPSPNTMAKDSMCAETVSKLRDEGCFAEYQYVRYVDFEAAMGDARQCLDAEMHHRHLLADDVERLRSELAEERHLRKASDVEHENAYKRLQTALEEESDQRSASCFKIEEEVCRLEEDVVRSGLASLEEKFEKTWRTVPADVSRASIVAMEAALDQHSTTLMKQLSQQEKRILSSNLSAVETRLEELAKSLRDDMNKQEERLFTEGMQRAGEPRFEGLMSSLREELLSSVGDELRESSRVDSRRQITDADSLNLRMNELAGMFREEARRQDALESRFNNLSSSLHDGLRRHEEFVIPESLGVLEDRFERLTILLRDELQRQETVSRSSLAALESQFAELSTAQKETSVEMQERILSAPHHRQTAVEDLTSRVGIMSAEIREEMSTLREGLSGLRTVVQNWDEKEKDIWHALDTHTHDLDASASAVAAAATVASSGASSVAASQLSTPHISLSVGGLASGQLPTSAAVTPYTPAGTHSVGQTAQLLVSAPKQVLSHSMLGFTTPVGSCGIGGASGSNGGSTATVTPPAPRRWNQAGDAGSAIAVLPNSGITPATPPQTAQFASSATPLSVPASLACAASASLLHSSSSTSAGAVSAVTGRNVRCASPRLRSHGDVSPQANAPVMIGATCSRPRVTSPSRGGGHLTLGPSASGTTTPVGTTSLPLGAPCGRNRSQRGTPCSSPIRDCSASRRGVSSSSASVRRDSSGRRQCATDVAVGPQQRRQSQSVLVPAVGDMSARLPVAASQQVRCSSGGRCFADGRGDGLGVKGVSAATDAVAGGVGTFGSESAHAAGSAKIVPRQIGPRS